MAIIKPTLTSAEGFIARGYETAQYEEDIRRKQLEIERMCNQRIRQEIDPYLQVLAPPPPLPHRLLPSQRNKRLLLCGN